MNSLILSPWTLAQDSLKYFLVRYLRDPKSGLPLRWLPHYDEWYRIVLEQARSDAQAPRGHGKSIFWSYALPLWDVIRGKGDVLLVSFSEDQVRELIRYIKQEVETNDFLAPIRPSTREIWGTDHLTFADGGSIAGLGFGTSSRGRHPKRIVVDDPLKDLGGISQDDQERAFFSVISGMAMPDTKIHVIGTPVEFGDLLEKLERNTAYFHWKKPALDRDMNPLCPGLFTLDVLMKRREEMGSLNFAREFLLQRIDPATAPFKRQYETFYSDLPGRWDRIVTVCDPAYSEGDGDFTGIVTVGFTHGNNAYVLEAKGIRREDPGKVVNELMRTIQTWNPDRVGIEKRKGDAIHYTFIEQRNRLGLFNFKYVELQNRGMSKSTRLKMVGGLVARWEARAVKIHEQMNLLRAQLYSFRFDESGSEHDDLVDALAYCFHPDMIDPNSGRQNVPLDMDEASLEGKPRYQVGQGDLWKPREVYEWVSTKTDYGRGYARRMDHRVSDPR